MNFILRYLPIINRWTGTEGVIQT